ncbi:MAG: hypothetical protein HQK91_12060 [Nitrospirae bacterium]|nr:hypothetical protein [Nitrospirota bacterium]
MGTFWRNEIINIEQPVDLTEEELETITDKVFKQDPKARESYEKIFEQGWSQYYIFCEFFPNAAEALLEEYCKIQTLKTQFMTRNDINAVHTSLILKSILKE